jgi:hypothetical protein
VFPFALAILLPAFAAAVFCSLGAQSLSLTVVPATLLGVVLFALLAICARRVPIGWANRAGAPASTVLSIIVLGLIARVLFALAVHPVAVSDMASYDLSARHLLTAHEYICREGTAIMRAFRPPGVAFLLAGTMAVVGQQPWAALLLNCVLYIATSLLLWKSAVDLPWQAVTLALGMLALWPSEVAVASLPQSESPAIMFSAALICVLVRVENLWTKTVLLGLITGLSCLLRNSNLLMIGVWWFVLLQTPVSFKKRAAMSVLVVISAFAPIVPWTIRNERLLGSPVLVATNGGWVFYSSNNSVTGGGWEETSERLLRVYVPDEIAMNKAGFRLAEAWIKSHPAQFVKLGFEKVRLLLGSDDWGPYWALERGRGYTGPGYIGDLVAAGIWWVALWAAVLIGFVRQPGRIREEVVLQAVVAVTILPAFLFFVFQSQPRYHAFMIPGLLFLAARLNSFTLVSDAFCRGRSNVEPDRGNYQTSGEDRSAGAIVAPARS